MLLKTAFPTRQCNPLQMICILLSLDFLWPGITAILNGMIFGNVFLMIGIMLPHILYFVYMIYKICSRSCRLRTFVRKWNEKKSNGVFISLGGTGRKVPVGNKTGGTLWSFLMATYDPRGKEGLGYLHIFVNYQQRETWCQQNGVPFTLSVPPDQLTIEQQIALQNLVAHVSA
jgi:hypothetical protein